MHLCCSKAAKLIMIGFKMIGVPPLDEDVPMLVEESCGYREWMHPLNVHGLTLPDLQWALSTAAFKTCYRLVSFAIQDTSNALLRIHAHHFNAILSATQHLLAPFGRGCVHSDFMWGLQSLCSTYVMLRCNDMCAYCDCRRLSSMYINSHVCPRQSPHHVFQYTNICVKPSHATAHMPVILAGAARQEGLGAISA